ncbi:hypothetical protein [Rhodoplanes elegans]|uniref:hypothetical protein n=1 Tax=Rhodoplanes elegans TaxID=29408 RepID=UPI00191383F6|nr:hypothetical protein [Rhodoplanes elegans]
MARKQDGRRRVTGGSKSVEFYFWIDAWTPSTIPMARLAEYMAQLATILGEANSVHFVKLKRGSTGLVHKVQPEAVQKVRERANAVRRGDAPRDALRAYEVVNKMLRDDNGVGALKEASSLIIPFPGREHQEERFSAIKERGTIDGEVLRVGGPHKWVPVLIESEGGAMSGCWADRATAKLLAHRLFESVRLHGTGKWSRSSEGRWLLQEFVIESFEPLNTASLSEALEAVRASDAFNDTSISDLTFLRHGPAEKQNGGH